MLAELYNVSWFSYMLLPVIVSTIHRYGLTIGKVVCNGFLEHQKKNNSVLQTLHPLVQMLRTHLSRCY